MSGITAAGLTSLLTGEDWHYVGATDEPAFQNDWANISTLPKLAFRRREAGVVDVQGTVQATGAGAVSGAAIFTLPEGYRPSVKSYIPIVAHTIAPANEGCYLIVGADGVVTPNYTLTTPQLFIYAQIFLTTPDVA